MTLGSQGYLNFSGYSWYRLTMQLDAAMAAQDLQLLFNSEYGPYEVYVNGNRVGGFGSFSPQKRRYIPRSMSFVAPKIRYSGQTRLLIAFRFWRPARLARFDVAGLAYGPIEIGTASVVQNRLAAEKYQQIRSQVFLILINCLLVLV